MLIGIYMQFMSCAISTTHQMCNFLVIFLTMLFCKKEKEKKIDVCYLKKINY